MTGAVVYDWDTPGLPPRIPAERCARHTHCAYRDDDPARCPYCHRDWWRIEDSPIAPTEPQTRAEHLAEHVAEDAARAKDNARRTATKTRRTATKSG